MNEESNFMKEWGEHGLPTMFLTFVASSVGVRELTKKTSATTSLGITSVTAAALYVIGWKYEKLNLLTYVAGGLAGGITTNALDIIIDIIKED